MAIKPQLAIDIIYENINFNKFEIIPIENASGRVCAQDIFAKYISPRFDNSAMDGYAVKLSDSNKEVKVIDKIFAGDIVDCELNQKTTIKIMTGAKIPKGCEAIVPQEEVQIIDTDTVLLPKNIKANQHIRFMAEDIKDNELLITDKEELNFSKITLLASQGISHIKVYQRPKVSVFASGEELKLHFQSIKSHQIYNSNTPTFLARAKELGCDTKFVGCAKDNIDSLKELISNSLDCDLIITSGGVSVGEADFTKNAFNEYDFETLINGIFIKPGKPTILGKINNTYILNLPGNPLASALIFELFGKIIIQKLSNSKNIYPNFICTKISTDYKNKARTTIVPGYFDGESFTPNEKNSPGMINILAKCNATIVVDNNVKELKEGSDVKVLPIDWKFFSEIKKDFITYE